MTRHSLWMWWKLFSYFHVDYCCCDLSAWFLRSLRLWWDPSTWFTSTHVYVFLQDSHTWCMCSKLFLWQHHMCSWFTFQQKDNTKPSTNGITVIEAPRQSDLMIELIKKLRPQVVVTGMANFEAVTSSAFEHILSTTREIGSRLFIDISDQFELSSLPSSNGVLKYLARIPLPSHVAVICGLLKNQVNSHPTIFSGLNGSGQVGSGQVGPNRQNLLTFFCIL